MTVASIDPLAINIAVASVFISAAVLVFRMWMAWKQYQWEKKSRALSYSITKNERLRFARSELAKAFELSTRNKPIEMSEVDTARKHIPEINTYISDILGHWENMSLAIEHEIVDEDVAFEMVASMVITFVYLFQKMIQQRRIDNKRAYRYLQEIVVLWQDKLEDGEISKTYAIKFES